MAEEKKEVELEEGNDNDAGASNYAITKNFFNFEGIGPIEGDVEDIDEVQLFCQTAGDASQINDICKQIFAFVAVKAYDANLTAGEMKASEHGLVMTSTYQELVSNLPMMEDFHEVFYKYWPGSDHELPHAFKDWSDAKFTKAKNGTDAGLNDWVSKTTTLFFVSLKTTTVSFLFYCWRRIVLLFLLTDNRSSSLYFNNVVQYLHPTLHVFIDKFSLLFKTRLVFKRKHSSNIIVGCSQ